MIKLPKDETINKYVIDTIKSKFLAPDLRGYVEADDDGEWVWLLGAPEKYIDNTCNNSLFHKLHLQGWVKMCTGYDKSKNDFEYTGVYYKMTFHGGVSYDKDAYVQSIDMMRVMVAEGAKKVSHS